MRGGGGGCVCGGEGRGHAGGYSEGERDEGVGVHGYRAEGGERRTVKAGAGRGTRFVGYVRVHEGGHDGDGLGGVPEERTELGADGGRVSGYGTRAFWCSAAARGESACKCEHWSSLPASVG